MATRDQIVILTGAGISAESGLKTFRDHDGLWEGHQVEEVATPEAFVRNPGLVQKFYNERRKQLLSDEVTPNRAHEALAEFEKNYSGKVTLITQNVDDLHQRAGSQNVLPMHGELLKSRCEDCGDVEDCRIDLNRDSVCSSCGSEESLRPHIVWFGEMPLYMDEIERVLEGVALFVAIGTSSAVYPAAGLRQMAQKRGAKTVELNLKLSDQSEMFDERVYGLATEVVPAYFEKVFSEN